MDTSLDDLDPRFKPLAIELLARLVERKILVIIINTYRTDAEQATAVATGHSWVARSKHQDRLAIDIAPYDTYIQHGANKILWDTSNPVWLQIGEIGESLGLKWGGRYHPIDANGIGKDPGHFEFAT